MKKCSSCGLEAEADQIFCLRCGQRLTDMQKTDSVHVDRLNRQSEQKGQGATAQKRSRRKWVILSVVLLVICIISTVTAVFMWDSAESYRSSYYSESRENAKLKEQYAAALKQKTFMDAYIAIVDGNGEDMLYHTYDCSTWDWDGEWSIMAYNIKAAELEGYTACPKCH